MIRFFAASIWTGHFLAPLVQDLGVVATFLGVLVAFWQIWRAKTTAASARLAATEAISESRRSFQRYAALPARHLVELVKTYQHHQDWRVAAMRLDDFAKHPSDLGYIQSPVDLEWIELAATSRSWSSTFRRKQEDTERWPFPSGSRNAARRRPSRPRHPPAAIRRTEPSRTQREIRPRPPAGQPTERTSSRQASRSKSKSGKSSP